MSLRLSDVRPVSACCVFIRAVCRNQAGLLLFARTWSDILIDKREGNFPPVGDNSYFGVE